MREKAAGRDSLARSLAVASSSRAAPRGAAACTRDRAPIRRSITHCIVICDPARRVRVRTRGSRWIAASEARDAARYAPDNLGDVVGDREIWEMPLLAIVLAGPDGLERITA